MQRLVLIVDDHDDNRELFAELLTVSGFSVAQAATGQQALDLAVELGPALILMDLALPDMTGSEAMRRLKGDVRTGHIPIVAVTGHALAEHRREAADAGCDAYLTKPLPPDVLVATVRRLCG